MAAQAQSPDNNKEPMAAVGYVRMAKGLLKMGETSLALNTLEKGLRKFPGNSNMHVMKGQALIALFNKKGKAEYLKAALSSLKKALKLDPQNYLAKILSSQIYLKAGARNRAKALLSDILKATPDDDRASALMSVIREKEERAAKKQTARIDVPKEPIPPEEKPEEAPPQATPPEKKAKEELEEGGELVISESLAGGETAAEEEIPEAKGDTSQWVLDDKVVIGAQEETEDEYMQEVMSAKLTIFSRLEGLNAIFLLDKEGMPLKILNKAKVDENIIPSLVFNLYNVSMNGVRRVGYGSFQRGTLVSPLGTIILANAFYATIAVIVDNDANLSSVEKRIQRYLEEVTG